MNTASVWIPFELVSHRPTESVVWKKLDTNFKLIPIFLSCPCWHFKHLLLASNTKHSESWFFFFLINYFHNNCRTPKTKKAKKKVVTCVLYKEISLLGIFICFFKSGWILKKNSQMSSLLDAESSWRSP